MPRIVTALAVQLGAAALLFAVVRVFAMPVSSFEFALACGLLAALAPAASRSTAERKCSVPSAARLNIPSVTQQCRWVWRGLSLFHVPLPLMLS